MKQRFTNIDQLMKIDEEESNRFKDELALKIKAKLEKYNNLPSKIEKLKNLNSNLKK